MEGRREGGRDEVGVGRCHSKASDHVAACVHTDML